MPPKLGWNLKRVHSDWRCFMTQEETDVFNALSMILMAVVKALPPRLRTTWRESCAQQSWISNIWTGLIERNLNSAMAAIIG